MLLLFLFLLFLLLLLLLLLLIDCMAFFKYLSQMINLIPATSAFLQQNVTVLIGGSQSKTSACALSTVTGIPLVRLHGNSMLFVQCEKTVDISADYRYFAHASFDIIDSLQWKKISLIYDGNQTTILS